MNVNTILQQLKAERQRIDQTIAAIEGLGTNHTQGAQRGRPKAAAAPAKRGRRPLRTMSAAAKAKLSRLMKQRWAARKKAGKSRLGA